jgi:RHH-type rel operon transcriptional repressor/antitoxin RelB
MYSMLALRLPPELEARLDALAKRTGRTKSYYAREAIIEHIEDLEDYYLAEERLRTTDGTTIAWEDVKAKHFDDDGRSK